MRLGATAVLFASLVATLASGAAGLESDVADAAEAREWTNVRSLLDAGAAVNAPQPDGTTALHWAAYHDDRGTVELLVKAGADVNATNRYGMPPLSLACTNRNGTVVKLLLEAGADANAALEGGETVLMTAARTGSLESVQALVAKGADVNAHRAQCANRADVGCRRGARAGG